MWLRASSPPPTSSSGRGHPLKHRHDTLTAMSSSGNQTTRRVPRKLVPVVLGLVMTTGAAANAAEHVTLRNGFDLVCDHFSAYGDRVRLYMDPSSTNFVELNAAEIASSEHVD